MTRPLERCAWSTMTNNPLMLRYHDEEWGVPEHNDKVLFEFLILEGAQAGLSWQTVLNKRENYRKALNRFNPAKIAGYNKNDVRRLLANPGIIRNRLKIEAMITNAKMLLETKREFGSFGAYVWRFVGGRPINHLFESMREIPATTTESDMLSRDLLKREFRFVGPTICYSFMQAVGMVNDHTTNCFRYRQISRGYRS